MIDNNFAAPNNKLTFSINPKNRFVMAENSLQNQKKEVSLLDALKTMDTSTLVILGLNFSRVMITLKKRNERMALIVLKRLKKSY